VIPAEKGTLRLPFVKHEKEYGHAAGAKRIDQGRKKFRRRNRASHEGQGSENEIPHPKGRNNQSPDQREKRRILEGHGRSMNAREAIRKSVNLPAGGQELRVQLESGVHIKPALFLFDSTPHCRNFEALRSLLDSRGSESIRCLLRGGERRARLF